MAVQVSYPGVYIEEFTPGAPIEGVGTSTAAFIGPALKGPFNKPTLIQSWDDFDRTFGGFIAEQPRTYLAPAAYGFFANGGTACYVLRVGSGQSAFANLDSRQAGGNPDPILIARARNEGLEGNAITVEVADKSRLAPILLQTIPTQTISKIDNDDTLTVNPNHGYSGGEIVELVKGNNQLAIVVEKSQGANNEEVVLAAKIPGNVDYTSGSLFLALGPKRAAARVSAMAQNRQQLTVSDNRQFAPGDRLLLTKGNDKADVTVQSRGLGNTLNLVAPITGNVNFGTGQVEVRTTDLVQGQKIIRLAVPSTLQLSSALPRGTAIKIEQGNKSEICTVDSSGGDTITLIDGLKNQYSLDSASNVPVITSLEFDLVVSSPTVKQPEKYEIVSMHPDHPNYWGSVVTSDLIILEEPALPPNPMPNDSRPLAKTYNLAQGQPDDRNAAVTLIKQNPTGYLDYFKPYDDISIVAIPGFTDQVVQQAIIAHCEAMRDRFAVLDSIKGAQPGNGIRTQFGSVRSEKGFAALYYPWIVTRNPLTGRDEQWPPSGHIAGIYARTDAQDGVHKAPANTNIVGAHGLEKLLTDEEQGPLNMMGINVLRVFQGRSQPVVWGARTTAGDLDRNWQYINVRRLFMFIEESIQENIRWAVFQPNNLQLWQKLKRTITEFLTRVWRDGALFGKAAEEAFYVRIDEALNPPSTQALGRLYIEIGVRPTYPAEFIVVRIGIWQGGSEVAEV
jgi:phage tail sheath protein FI